MSFKVTIQAPDLTRQIELLKFYPEISEKHFYPAVQGAVRDMGALIRPNIPVRTGTAVSTFKTKVLGRGINIEGRVGWWGKGQTWYINIVEYGARAHSMDTFVPGLGVWIGDHPGVAARGFMAKGYDQGSEKAKQRVAEAAERVVNDLAVK